MKSGSLSQPNTENEYLDATRRTSPQGHPDRTIPTPYAQIIYPCTVAAAQRTLPSYIGVCHLSPAAPRILPHLPTTIPSTSRIYLKRSISRCDVSRQRSWTCRLASCLCASAPPLQVDIESNHQMDHHTPVVGTVISVVVSLVSITIISSFLSGSFCLFPRRPTHPPTNLSPATPPNGIS